MSDELAVEILDRGPDVVIALTGELDFGTNAAFLDQVQPFADAGRALILDLDQVTFCDSSGLGALVRLHQLSQAAGGGLVLARLQPQLESTIKLTMLHRLLSIQTEVP
ncbi:STAS domain-containing protein [Kribbella sp. NBC_01505]|uniref:STAS domain-containing protein n=1 Tax=Kribbella sp. NBC_01505 TaxID=2903580 RepID=UPI003870BBCA